ncbi:MAG: hypothetical protein K9K82_12645 [Desulfobacteraceae bacterium]|nr:hypothetical protein [Desulfobacteraceae bacterium]
MKKDSFPGVLGALSDRQGAGGFIWNREGAKGAKRGAKKIPFISAG